MSPEERDAFIRGISDDVEDIKNIVTQLLAIVLGAKNGIEEMAQSGGMGGMLARSLMPMPMVHP